MLLTKIILKDFGVYSGVNEFDFSCDDGKPIILIGGTNGAGKTTLFDSVMLCLYGMSSFGKKTTRITYEKFLKQKIHRYLGAPVSADHASIIVQFKFFHNNEISEYQVNRTWRNDDGKIIEELFIKKRTTEEQFQPIDNVEKSYWQSFIEDLIPKGIARLFFFDGEKIIVTFEYRQPYQSELLAYSASKRYEKEVGGITVDGYSIYTDRQSQSMLTGIVTLMQLKPNTVISFKTANGFISANATIINDIAISIANHIESCFNLENDVASEIQANTIVTFTQIDDKY